MKLKDDGMVKRTIYEDSPEAEELPSRLSYLHMSLFCPVMDKEDFLYHCKHCTGMYGLQQAHQFRVQDAKPGVVIGECGTLYFDVVEDLNRSWEYGWAMLGYPRKGGAPSLDVEIQVPKHSSLYAHLGLICNHLYDFKDFSFHIKLAIESEPCFIETYDPKRPAEGIVKSAGRIQGMQFIVDKKLGNIVALGSHEDAVGIWELDKGKKSFVGSFSM